jgi:secreted trypsin-like serine protease
MQLAAGKYMTVGVASFVSRSGCESEMPEAFTRVGEYLNWIKSETGIKINP